MHMWCMYNEVTNRLYTGYIYPMMRMSFNVHFGTAIQRYYPPAKLLKCRGRGGGDSWLYRSKQPMNTCKQPNNVSVEGKAAAPLNSIAINKLLTHFNNL